MTKKQTDTLARLRSEQVAFPPLFELDDGNLRVLLVLSFGQMRSGFPSDIVIESAVIDKRGHVSQQNIVHYGPLRKGRTND